MDGLDHAAPIDALRRRLRRIRPPKASIAFRHQARRDFEHALDRSVHRALSPSRSEAGRATRSPNAESQGAASNDGTRTPGRS
jgi:hypothetical protein